MLSTHVPTHQTRKALLSSLFLFCLLSFTSCHRGDRSHDQPSLVSIQVVDRNGFAETVSSKDRLLRYQETEFCDPQPYQKVLRVFSKNKEGRSFSKITSYHTNGHIWQYLEALDGRAHGLYKEWHPNGKLKMELLVIEGIADLSEAALASFIFEGINRIWDDQGHLLALIPYEKGMLHGDSLYYYPEGSLQKRIPYFQNNPHGECFLYAKGGALLERVSYEQGKPHGLAVSYKEDGSLLYEEYFEEGLLKEGCYYQEDGKVFSTLHEGVGKRVEFEGGILARLVEYKKGVPEGQVECFTKNGILNSSYYQKEGKKEGEEREYYLEKPNQLKLSLYWQEDVLQGPVKTWFLEGGQESQREMYQNKKNGPLYAWYKNGDLMLREEYENDLLITGSYYKKGDKKPVSKITNGKGIATLHTCDGYFLKKIRYEKGRPTLDEEEGS